MCDEAPESGSHCEMSISVSWSELSLLNLISLSVGIGSRSLKVSTEPLVASVSSMTISMTYLTLSFWLRKKPLALSWKTVHLSNQFS